MAIQTSLTSEEFRKIILSADTEEGKTRQNEPTRRKPSSRKISFKVRKSSSAYRKNIGFNIQKTTIRASTVAELASKFNQIIEKHNHSNEEVKLKEFVKRINSVENSDNLIAMKQISNNSTNETYRKEQRKPSIKKKPILDEKISKVQIIRRTKIPNASPKIPEKKKELELEKNGNIGDNSRAKIHPENFKLMKATSVGFVKAAIENFEKKKFQPIKTQRSLTDTHLVRTFELEANRRRSCKPDFNIPIQLQKEANQTETNKDEYKQQLINSQNELNLQITERISEKLKTVVSSDVHQISPEPPMEIETSNNSSMLHESTSSLNEEVNLRIHEKRHFKETIHTRNNNIEESYNDMTDSVKTTLSKILETKQILQDDEYEPVVQEIRPNNSFLWTRGLSKNYQDISKQSRPFDFSTILLPKNLDVPEKKTSKTLPRDFKGEFTQYKEEIYTELGTEDGYELFDLNKDYEEVKSKTEIVEESEYEYLENEVENIYETLPSTKQDEPLPNRPTSKNSGSYYTIKNEESVSNCYESIYNSDTVNTQADENYESIYFRDSSVKNENSEKDIAGSIVSSEQKTNSLYGTSLRSWNEGTIYNGSATSDISFSDKSEWIDVSEAEDDGTSKFIIIKEATKSKKSGTWSQQCRQQWSKHPPLNEGADSDSDHHYETLQASDDEAQDIYYDSFASDTESEDSFENLENGNNGDLPLPLAPNSNDVLTRLAASATKHMRKFTKNLSMTRNDISKSLTRIARRKSKTDISETTEDNSYDNINETPVTTPTSEVNPLTKAEVDENNERNKSLSRKGFLHKIRRSIIMSPEQASEITSQINNKGRSTFYLTPTINVDDPDDAGERKPEDDSGISLSPVDRDRNSRNRPMRPMNPPPPAPILSLNEDLKKTFKEKRSTSWYAEVDLRRGSDITTKVKEKRPNTCWYDEIGLYQKSASTPSTSSAENSGTNTTVAIRPTNTPPTTQSNGNGKDEKYYSSKLENTYYNNSVHSLETNGTKTDLSISSLSGDDIQMRLQMEPLYQFYDAAVLDSVCHDGILDLDSDNYEDVENKSNLEHRPPSRPSAMELIIPKRNSLAFTKTLWCEIPEVLQSSVLSTLSPHQKKLQEAKFEMVTSEASYLNSLNVLNDHFITNLKSVLTEYEYEILFVKIEAVRKSSEKLLLHLEKCWQDNILLNGVCDIIQKHAEEDFSVYIPYCENHMLLEQIMKKLRDRPTFVETLKQLEASPVCQCLSLYSFLMLPMQRITRWPLLLDAVLKRLEQHDPEYITCQYVLATTSKIVSQCNEAAKQKDRELEMLSIESRMEFSKGVPPFSLAVPNRWLIRSGTITHMQPKSEEIKLTFGKKISKASLHLFLFNDLLIVAKPKSENMFSVMHYCSRNLTELSTSDQLLSIPGKDMTGKHLFFLTLLENQNRKTVEFLLSCSSESDKQRWIEALSPPKSEDPDEVLYECWDCPQVTVIHNYMAVQPDELNLSKGDVINVSRKMTDGWYQGERIRDGQTGWFPANYTAEIANPHVRARNLKQRYRLLTFSENYLKNK